MKQVNDWAQGRGRLAYEIEYKLSYEKIYLPNNIIDLEECSFLIFLEVLASSWSQSRVGPKQTALFGLGHANNQLGIHCQISLSVPLPLCQNQY